MLILAQIKAGKFRRHRKSLALLAAAAVLGAGLLFMNTLSANLGLEEADIGLGATFSKPYASSLDLDWRETFLAALDDLKIRLWRLPAYWDDLEPEPGSYDFSIIDWQVREAASRGSRIILAVGRKLPRWPECRVPKWTAGLDEEIVRKKILAMIGETVRHFRSEPAIVAWQVENEPLFKFGECPAPDVNFLKTEIALVKSLDARPVVITESGELSTWVRAANLADILGVSTYRVVWNPLIGYFYWPITPKDYARRALAVSAIVPKIISSELQAEPWVTEAITSLPIDRQLQLMDPAQLRSNVAFARRIGFSEAYLWGVEWWYWLKRQGRPEMWEAAKQLYAEAAARTSGAVKAAK
ncbi:MAG: beta-galactosidase [Patescibacteria group bacterium]|jgi:hypothetical protein